MYANLSKTLEAIFARAAFQATKRGTTHCLDYHLALNLLEEEGSLAYQLITARISAWEMDRLRRAIEAEISPTTASIIENSEPLFRAFYARLITRFPDVKRISTLHAFITLLAAPHTPLHTHFSRYHITAELLEEELQKLTTPQSDEEPIRSLVPQKQPQHEPLERFGTDLTELAREGLLDPVVGREEEIDRLVCILTRRKKNNPLLLGDAGVGKTALIEGLAQRIVCGEVPQALRHKRILSLEVASLVAGTKFRGEFEERLQQLLEQVRQDRRTILFVDEIHTIVGAGATQGSLEMANILKPALARGEVQLIGATTHDEYRREMERDRALERRFQRLTVEPPTAETTLAILRRLAPAYAQHHGVNYTEEALTSCVALADRYLTQRAFPDKAIDLLDEAGARVSQQAHATANARDLSLRQARQRALDEARYPAAEALHLAELHQPFRSADEKAASPTVDAEAIRRTLTELTGIPANRLSQDEATRLNTLSARLQSRIIGQQEAAERLARALQRARTGLQHPHRPIGVFLFVGPTGVGKSLMAKELAHQLFDNGQGLIRIDMSEYGEKHTVARLLGAPPGYVGYGEGGQLTEAVRRQPHAVVLLDEVEKAHPEVLNLLLQLCDEGELTDGMGRRIDFRHTVVIMTSNIGSQRIAQMPRPLGYTASTAGKEDRRTTEASYHKALEQAFRPELLGRFDEILIFGSLQEQELAKILDLEIQTLGTRALQAGYTLDVTPEAREHLTKLCADLRHGARSLRRLLMTHLETPLAELLIALSPKAGDKIVVEHRSDNGLHLRIA